MRKLKNYISNTFNGISKRFNKNKCIENELKVLLKAIKK